MLHFECAECSPKAQVRPACDVTMQEVLCVLVTILTSRSPFPLNLHLYFSDKMLSRIDWINSQAAIDASALAAEDGCNHEEVNALSDYLSDSIGVQEAAENIVSPVLREADPSSELYRLWGLLSNTLVELKEDRKTLIDLLAAIQSLPPHTCIDWSHLADFGQTCSACIHMVVISGRRRTGPTLAKPNCVNTSKPLVEQRLRCSFAV
jgi:hypothetical protein